MDFERRVEPSELPEWMDGSCSYEDFRDCLVDLEQVNRWSLGYRPTLAWLDRLVDFARTGEALRIVDVGCGGGDLLRRVAEWARRRGVEVRLVGVDLNPYAARAAREFGGDEGIEWVSGNAFSYAGDVDVVVSSLFTHHLEEDEVVRFLRWMEATARRGWFVNDLCREAAPYYAFGWLAKAAGWHRFVQHDGPVSFRRAFREDDWLRMCAEAGIAGADVNLRRWRPARLCVGRLK
ncbi:MAG TPA: methyltransferase domain-containing protein [Acidobacteriaceae bacterium]